MKNITLVILFCLFIINSCNKIIIAPPIVPGVSLELANHRKETISNINYTIFIAIPEEATEPLKTHEIINFEISNITINNFLKKVLYWAKKKKSHYICVSSVHGCIESFRSKKFKIAHNSADIAVADGRPIFWALKLLGSKDADHLPGYYITEEISNLANKTGLKIGFYGSTKKRLNKT